MGAESLLITSPTICLSQTRPQAKCPESTWGSKASTEMMAL